MRDRSQFRSISRPLQRAARDSGVITSARSSVIPRYSPDPSSTKRSRGEAPASDFEPRSTQRACLVFYVFSLPRRMSAVHRPILFASRTPVPHPATISSPLPSSPSYLSPFSSSLAFRYHPYAQIFWDRRSPDMQNHLSSPNEKVQ